MTDNDQDPTGMRHLLAGLKETGPMPADLARRIHASLEDERTDTAHKTGPEGTSSFWTTMDDQELDTGPTPLRRRRSAAPWILGAAAATVVALGVGGLMLRDSGPAGSGDSAGAAAPQTSAATSSDSARSEAKDGSEDDEGVPAFAITASGADYSEDTLADGAAKLLKDPATFPANKDDRAVGTLTTAAGATDCLARLGQPQMQAVVVDVATFDGEDGLLLIAESLPDGPSRAWAITSGCEPIWKGPVEVPQG